MCCKNVTLVFILRWLQNDVRSLKLHRRMAYCFSRSSIKSQGHLGWKINFDLKIVTPVWIHRCLQKINNAWSVIEEAPYCFSRSHGLKNLFAFDLNKITRPATAIKSPDFSFFKVCAFFITFKVIDVTAYFRDFCSIQFKIETINLVCVLANLIWFPKQHINELV